VAGARGDLALVLSRYVIGEIRRNLTNKAPRALSYFDIFLAFGHVQLVDPPAALVRQVAADIALKDAPIVAGAIHAEAKFLVTYDRKHFLTQADLIQDRFGITVGTPEAVLAPIE
jgi:predicted nucleic acid-binding protein